MFYNQAVIARLDHTGRKVILEATRPGDRDLIAALDNIRGYEDRVFMKPEYDPRKGKTVKKKKVERKLYRIIKTSSDFSRATYNRFLHDPIISTLIYSGMTGVEEAQVPNSPPIEINEKWQGILRDYQMESLEALLKRDHGIAKLYTGAGKLEMALAVIESYLEQYEGHVIVLVPTNSIRDEWHWRMEKWEVNSPRITVVNPVGLMRRKSLNEFLEKWKDPGLIIADEVHHIQAKSWLDFLSVIGKIDYTYGFSATPEVKGMDIKESSDLLGKMYPLSAYKLARATGPVRTERYPKERDKTVELHVIDGRLADRKITPDEEHYVHLVEATITNRDVTRLLAGDLRNDPEMKLYIPVITKSSGLVLATQYAAEGIPAIYWDATKATLFEPGKPPRVLPDIGEIKRMIEEGIARVLITTSLSYEGVDLPSLNAVLLVHGRNDRMILQPLGRSARGGKTRVYIVADRNNPALMSQARKRIWLIRKQYNVSKEYARVIGGLF